MKEPINLHETLWQPCQLLGLGDSPSVQAEGSRYLKSGASLTASSTDIPQVTEPFTLPASLRSRLLAIAKQC